MSTAALVARIDTVAALLRLALAATDPMRQAELLGMAQNHLAWATREAVLDCRRGENVVPLRQLAENLRLNHSVLYRQIRSGAPVVTVRTFYSAGSRNAQPDGHGCDLSLPDAS